ncbi:MAG: hypothetical protein JWP13_531 [Candidatus Saccharibacteria bacterium]|nr:hypothetical protein [Candidatus Saccharibacteria bacterium]
MGNNIKNTIDINGKRYDAVSGAFLGQAGAAQRTSGKFVDGFRPVSQSNTQSAVKPLQRAPHSPASHAVAHKPEPTHTLMRSAVKKPRITAPSVIKAQTRTDILAKTPKQIVTPKLSHTGVDPHRLKKATQMSKSPVVSRYGTAHNPTQAMAFTPSTNQVAPRLTQTMSTPVIPVAPVRQHAKPTDIFEQALAQATSHEQKFDDKKKGKGRRIRSLITASVSVLLVAGMIAYFNAPALSLKMASTRAGFEAKLPGYSPAGYQFGDISYGPGNVTVSYEAADKSSKFDITQKVSDWDSQALLNNFVDTANKAYQTYERAGRTVYFFGNNTATWVDSGVWYTVNGNNSLTKNQLLDLAGSL